MPTKQVPFRLDTADRERITAIREHFGLESDASAVRYAVRRVAEQLPPAQAPQAGAKKSRKIPG